jgi:hypothetical protein
MIPTFRDGEKLRNLHVHLPVTWTLARALATVNARAEVSANFSQRDDTVQ